jgi:hypothetical protein
MKLAKVNDPETSRIHISPDLYHAIDLVVVLIE